MTRRNSLAFCLVLLCTLASLGALAQESAPEPKAAALELSILDCVDRALQENLLLEIERINPELQSQAVRMERSIYDIALSGDVLHQDLDTPASGALSGANVGSGTGGTLFGGSPTLGGVQSDNTSARIGIAQYLSTGTTYSADLEYNRQETDSVFRGFNPEYTWDLNLQATQPLLSGWNGIETRARIRIAENLRESARLALTQSAMDLTLATIQRYWELVYTHSDLAIKQESLDLANDLLRIKRAEVAAGVEAPIEVVSASAGVAQRLQDVIVARNSIGNAEDELRRIINVGADPRAWEQPLRPSDTPGFAPHETDLDESIAVALEKRPLLRLAEVTLKNEQISVNAAKNRLLPSLDVTGGIAFHGLERSTGKAWDVGTRGDYYSWNIGLLFAYPLGNNAARSQFTQAQLRERQASFQVEDARQAVIQDVRLAMRTLHNSAERIDAARAARVLAAERLEAIQKTYGVGLATAFDVLQYQEDFSRAKVDELRAVIDHILSIALLERAEGTILEKRGLTIE